MRIQAGRISVVVFISIAFLVSCGSEEFSSPRGKSARENLSLPTRFEAILSISDPMERTREWLVFLDSLQPSDAQQVGEQFGESVGRLDEAAAILIGSWWTEVDPLAALHAGAGWHWDGKRLGIRIVLRRWAALDPRAAFGILQEMPLKNEQDLQNAAGALATGFFEADPVPDRSELGRVLGTLTPLSDPKSRHVAFDALIAGMITRWGLDESQRFVDGMSAGPQANIHRDFSLRFVSQFAGIDPKRAVAWLDGVAPGETGANLRRRLGARWARFDGPAAMQWASGQPTGKDRDMIMEHTYRNFVSSDETAAVEWMHERVNDDALTPALPMFLARLSRSQPEQAAEWVSLVEDPKGRRIAALNVARAWLRADESAARDWLPESGLSPRDRASVLARLNSPN